MDKKLIVNVSDHETRVALLEDGTIAELFVERKDESDIAGNIYKGRVQRVLPGMQAAFVDIGLSQAAFIYVDDVIDENRAEFEKIFSSDPGENGPVDPAEDTPLAAQKPAHIEEVLAEGQEIMVQVAKSSIGTKGARVTCHISLPGRFLVLMPTSTHVGVSRRIEDEAERNRLKSLMLELREGEVGYIVRTAAEGVQPEKFAYEMDFLKNLWNNIQAKYRSTSAPSLLHQELAVSLRAVRDILTHEAGEVIVDSRSTYESIVSFLETFMPSLRGHVEYYDGQEPIFDAYNLEGDITRALKKKVWLKSGGYIVIEHTEALVAIDVNTGRYVGKHNLEETILKTNLEAVKEIAYQVRLRDIGGIIIIDFIDMAKKSNQEKVFNALKEALKKDRSKTHILPMSDMGLIQMTRKRVRKPLNRLLCEPCFYCEGEGYLMSGRSICYNIYREVMRDIRDMTGRMLTIRVNPDIAELLHGEENHIIVALEREAGRQIVVYPNHDFHLEEFDIFESARTS
jgi:ribonuclease G